MLWVNVVIATSEEIHSQFQEMAVLLFHDKKNKASEKVCEAAWDPHAPASARDIGNA
jgi:hypothetical protein